jgi:hypothetical protein
VRCLNSIQYVQFFLVTIYTHTLVSVVYCYFFILSIILGLLTMKIKQIINAYERMKEGQIV